MECGSYAPNLIFCYRRGSRLSQVAGTEYPVCEIRTFGSKASNDGPIGRNAATIPTRRARTRRPCYSGICQRRHGPRPEIDLTDSRSLRCRIDDPMHLPIVRTRRLSAVFKPLSALGACRRPLCARAEPGRATGRAPIPRGRGADGVRTASGRSCPALSP